MLTGTLTRPGKAPAAVLDGATFQIEAADQGGTITLDVTAANSAGSVTESTTLVVPGAAPPVVANAQNGGYAGTTPSVTADGTVTIANTASAITGEHGVSHYLVRADNMQGKTLKVRRSAGSPNDIGNDLSVWQMAWAYDPEGEWSAFSVVNSSGTIVATENTPMTQPSVYIARRPVFTNARWDQAIARWRASPHTSPTASGDANFVIGTLPANSHAPAMDAYGFKFGTGPRAIVVTGNIHVEEHIAAYAYEAFVDWLLGDSAEATWLRGQITVYCYPKINPQSRYAGASRQEVVSGENANRIFSSAYDHIPLSKMMRDAWAADLPATITGALDFHDVPPGPRRAEMFYSGEGEFASRLAARYKARTGLDATIFPPNTTDGMIATYMLQNFGATWTTTPEHGILNTVGVPEWQTWGLDVAATLHDYVLNPPGQIDWITPAWTSTNTSTITTNANGSVTVANAGNPGASFRIPDGTSIEVVIDLTLANANYVFLRHSAVATLDPAQSIELHRRDTSTAPYYRVQQIAWDATRPYFGVFAARQNTANPASYTLLPTVKYRVLP